MSHLTSKFKSTPTFTFKSRNTTVTSSNRPDAKPSPFHYHPAQPENTKPLGKFSHEKRIKQIAESDRNLQPGPGAYESLVSVNLGSFHKGETLRRGQRRFHESRNLTPGPSHYNSIEREAKSVPKYSFFREKRQKEQANSVSVLPSPGSYDPKQLQSPSASFSIGHAKRKDNLLPTRSPGPGAYLHEGEFASSTSFNQKSLILPRAKRSSSALDFLTPAPNSYTSQSFIEENAKKQKGFTCQRRYSHKHLQTPPPNLYHNQTRKSDPKVGFPKAQRAFLTPELRRSGSTPGPGSHELEVIDSIKFNTSRSSKFPKSKLARLLQDASAPKLAFINPEKLDVTRPGIPKFSIPAAAKLTEQKRLVVDRFYDAKLVSQSEKSFKIPQEKRLLPLEPSSVGPGYYSTEVTTKVIERKAKFPREKRKTFVESAMEEKARLFRGESFEGREEFPNPPAYMGVQKKLAINHQAIKRY